MSLLRRLSGALALTQFVATFVVAPAVHLALHRLPHTHDGGAVSYAVATEPRGHHHNELELVYQQRAEQRHQHDAFGNDIPHPGQSSKPRHAEQQSVFHFAATTVPAPSIFVVEPPSSELLVLRRALHKGRSRDLLSLRLGRAPPSVLS